MDRFLQRVARTGLALCLLPALAMAAPAYRFQSLERVAKLGRFVPVTMTDAGGVVGTLYPAGGGSLALQVRDRAISTADYCGTAGAADNTVVAATSPYSARQFVQGYCTPAGASKALFYVRDMRAQSTSFPQAPADLFAAQFVNGVTNSGTVVGDCCYSGGTILGFFLRGSSSGSFGYNNLNGVTGVGAGETYFGWTNATTYGGTAGVIWALPAKVYVDFPAPYPANCIYTTLQAANAAREAIGVYLTNGDQGHCPDNGTLPFFFGPFGSYIVPPGALNSATTHLAALNENGTVAGTYQDSNGTHLFVWQPVTGQVVPLPVPAGATGVQPIAINNHGDITGVYTIGSSQLAFIERCVGNSCT